MNSHKHARLTPRGRALLMTRMLEESRTLRSAAEAAGISVRTGAKWLARYREHGAAGLVDRSSRLGAAREHCLEHCCRPFGVSGSPSRRAWEIAWRKPSGQLRCFA